MNKIIKPIAGIGLLPCLLGLSGCVTKKVTVDPALHHNFQDYLMASDRDKLAVKMYDHGFFSREGSRGGRGIGGGGCGCN
jgi:hypothetical protein